MGANLLMRFSNWLHRAPVIGPVDRRNAWFMQMLFMFVGTTIPLNKLYVVFYSSRFASLFTGDMFRYAHIAAMTDIATDLAMTASAWFGLWLIRQGQFRRAITQFLYVVIGAGLLAYATFGYWAIFSDMLPIMIIALSGLMLGRRALWLVYMMVMVEFMVGMASDLLRHEEVLHIAFRKGDLHDGIVNFPSRALNYLLVVFILDYSTHALRESLRESEEHRLLLQEEIHEHKQAQEALLHAQKMDAVGRLASGVAHDFNNILGVILGFTRERHRLDDPDSPPANHVGRALASALEGIETASRRGATISRKLLNFSRRDVPRAEIFDLNESLRELKPMLQQLLPTPMVVELQTAAEPLAIRFDRSQFELALLNLASNARDAMPDGGTLTIASHARNGHAVLTVSDTGSGMSREIQRHIFEPFFTTKPTDLGTGLGLPVVFDLVKRAGGNIEVDSAPGHGTRFVIELPRMSCCPREADACVTPKAVRVLLIDANDDLSQLLAERLRDGGCVVSTAINAREVERVFSQSPLPHVIVCDSHMPDIDGVTLMERLRLCLQDAPIILTATTLDLPELAFGSSDALTERLPKPFLPDQLLDRVLTVASGCAEQGKPVRLRAAAR
ncbi:MAG TPA: ATP-binding protein [Rhodanobacter sp.]|nr:ATP-binding protein [Rhodanobacter sp.]